jgi:hypothetical protein
MSWALALQSVTQIHNETVNIWLHLLAGAACHLLQIAMQIEGIQQAKGLTVFDEILLFKIKDPYFSLTKRFIFCGALLKLTHAHHTAILTLRAVPYNPLHTRAIPSHDDDCGAQTWWEWAGGPKPIKGRFLFSFFFLRLFSLISFNGKRFNAQVSPRSTVVVTHKPGLPSPTASGCGVRGSLLLPQCRVPHLPVYVSHGLPMVAEGMELLFSRFFLLRFLKALHVS